jgi:hypothetical protein
MDRFSFEADLFVWFVAASICFWRATLQSPNDAHAQFDVLASRSGREGSLPPNFFTLLESTDISGCFSYFEYFRWDCGQFAAAARSSTALTLIYGLGQSAEVAMLLFLFQKHPNSYFFSRQLHCNLIISQWISTENKQQIPFEKMATDCSKLARRPFWNHFESGYCFGLVSILRFKLFISRNGSRRCSSNHRLNELLQSSIKANSKGWWFLRRKWSTSICR